MPRSTRTIRHAPLALAALLCLPATPAQAGRAAGQSAQATQSVQAAQSGCAQMQELYLTCHRLGRQADSTQTCEEAAYEYVQRAAGPAGKVSQAGRARAELVCTTGCEDGVSGQPPATPQELAEAFCDPLPTAKSQGGRQ